MIWLWSEISVADSPFFKCGNTVTIGERKLRILDRPYDSFTLLVAPAGWRFYLVLVVYRLRQTFKRTGQFIISVLAIWGLASWDPVTVPTWKCIHPLRWLSQLLRRKQGENQ